MKVFIPLLFLCVVFLCVVFLCAGCSTKVAYQLEFNPNEPIRVAVLPFAQVNKNGEFIEPDPNYLIDNVSLVSAKLKEPPAEYVRRLVQSELAKTSLDIVAPALIEAQLGHNGFVKASDKVSLDVPRIHQADPKLLCSRLLQCDALLYGKVTKWERAYLGIQTVHSVGVELKLISAADGKVLFQTSAQDAEGRGLTKGPTGFSDLVIEPLRGLDNKIITDLAQSMIAKVIAPLVVRDRPEYLEQAPPAIFAASHDALEGKATEGNVARSRGLTVLLLGNADQTATFSVGDVIQNVPMVEKDGGHYIGEYIPLESDAFKGQPVFVYLTDQYGRTTFRQVGSQKVNLSSAR